MYPKVWTCNSNKSQRIKSLTHRIVGVYAFRFYVKGCRLIKPLNLPVRQQFPGPFKRSEDQWYKSNQQSWSWQVILISCNIISRGNLVFILQDILHLPDIWPGSLKKSYHHVLLLCATPWASYYIRKIVGYVWAGNAGNVFHRHRIQRKPRVSDPSMHHGTCRDACRDCLPAVAGKTFPAFPAHA